MLYSLKEEMAPQELTRRLATVITHVDEIMQQEVRPLVAVDIIEQLHRQFAILSGGRGKDGAPIITFPEFAGFKRIPDEDFLNVMTYLTSIPSAEAASIGFVIVIDRRRDKWSSIKASLTRIAVAFPGNLQLIFILRPSHFIQRTFTEIGIKYYRDEFKMKVPIIMLNSISDLHSYIDRSQLTQELGGTLEYRHSQWISHRTVSTNLRAIFCTHTARQYSTSHVLTSNAGLWVFILQEPLEKAQLLALVGDQFIQNHHYAVDTIRPRCVELRHLCDDFINENKKRYDILGKSLELHRQLDKVSQWCEAGIFLLASQAVDKCQSREGVDVALNDIETFLSTAKECRLLSPKEFYNQFELILTPDVKAKAQRVLQKLADVQEVFHKRQVSLMKLAAKQTRPVQPVAPHPESSPKWVSPKTSQPSALALSPSLVSLSLSTFHLLLRFRRIVRDLLETEEIYIKEIKSIIDGYITPMDFIWLKHLIPDVLQNNKDFLFGNIRELYEFHNRTFLKELEKCTENPDLLAHCFINRKEDLQIYFKYHKNLPRARAIWQECQDCAYFGVCQRQLGHNLPLFKYLRGPSQRLMKYQMLLKSLLDLASPEDLEIDPGDLEGGDGPQRTKDSALSAELQQALAVVEDLIKSCELAEGLAAVTGCPDDIGKLGKLLMQGPFNVWTIHKDRYKMKDFIRFKPSQRQIYLFERGIVFCKIRMEPSDQGFSPHYSFKKSMKLVTLSIRQVGRGSNKKFEIANRSGLEKYILQATSKEIRDCWFSEISKLLLEQENNIKGRGPCQLSAGQLSSFHLCGGCPPGQLFSQKPQSHPGKCQQRFNAILPFRRCTTSFSSVEKELTYLKICSQSSEFYILHILYNHCYSKSNSKGFFKNFSSYFLNSSQFCLHLFFSLFHTLF
uniref:MCF.2 cell line derived transforming sequence-like 2 n=1 Tax=Oryctolagus cuniculus TaxID=9986 RepID=A0A5F9DEM2_RABIT